MKKIMIITFCIMMLTACGTNDITKQQPQHSNHAVDVNDNVNNGKDKRRKC